MNPILEKIKKLLRMKRGGTPDEIATALRLAQELADKHGIDINSVNPDDDQRRTEAPISHAEELLGSRVQFECKYAGMICDVFFHVNVFVHQICPAWRGKGAVYRMVFVGTDWDREFALYVYHFLVGHFRRQWNHHRGRYRNRQNFLWGMYCGLSSKLRERQPPTIQTPGIIRIDQALQRRHDYIAANFGRLRERDVSPDSDASAALQRGYLAGRQTEIRPAVNTAEARPQLETSRLRLTAPAPAQCDLPL